MSRATPSLTAPAVAVVVAVAWVPLLLVLLAAVPTDTRPPLFVGGLTLTAGLAFWGGVRGRRALLEDTPRKGRAAAIAWLGLMIGATTAVFCGWAAIGLLS